MAHRTTNIINHTGSIIITSDFKKKGWGGNQCEMKAFLQTAKLPQAEKLATNKGCLS